MWWPSERGLACFCAVLVLLWVSPLSLIFLLIIFCRFCSLAYVCYCLFLCYLFVWSLEHSWWPFLWRLFFRASSSREPTREAMSKKTRKKETSPLLLFNFLFLLLLSAYEGFCPLGGWFSSHGGVGETSFLPFMCLITSCFWWEAILVAFLYLIVVNRREKRINVVG